MEGTPSSWPLWLRAAAPGNVSLYVTIYYEMEDTTSVMKYRTLRMQFNLEVCLVLNADGCIICIYFPSSLNVSAESGVLICMRS